MAETIVRMVDRLSTEVYHAKQAFQNTPDYYWYTKNPVNNRIYKRLDAYFGAFRPPISGLYDR